MLYVNENYICKYVSKCVYTGLFRHIFRWMHNPGSYLKGRRRKNMRKNDSFILLRYLEKIARSTRPKTGRFFRSNIFFSAEEASCMPLHAVCTM